MEGTKLKRIAILLAAVAMFASTATIALADHEVGSDGATEDTEEREINETQQAKAELLAKFLVYDYSEDGAPAEAEEPTPQELETAAEELVTTTEAIAALRTGETVVGWGAIFKLIQLYKLLPIEGEDGYAGQTFDMMVKELGDEGWAFGKRFKEYRDDLRKSTDGAPKNFGQLKKQDRAEKSNKGKKSAKP
jgi:hypothetical protein